MENEEKKKTAALILMEKLQLPAGNEMNVGEKNFRRTKIINGRVGISPFFAFLKKIPYTSAVPGSTEI